MAKSRSGMFRQSKKGRGQAAAGSGVNAEMVRRAQELQTKLQEAQTEIRETIVEASAGGGALTVQMGGDHKLRMVSIERELLNPEDVEILQDLVIAAVNESTDKLEAMQEERLAGLTSGLPIPGLD